MLRNFFPAKLSFPFFFSFFFFFLKLTIEKSSETIKSALELDSSVINLRLRYVQNFITRLFIPPPLRSNILVFFTYLFISFFSGQLCRRFASRRRAKERGSIFSADKIERFIKHAKGERGRVFSRERRACPRLGGGVITS